VSRRALDALGRILGVPADALAWSGPGPQPAGAVLRATNAAPAGVDRLARLAELATTDADDWDDADDLFLGGRDLL
jgi:hypothetical protein